MRKSRAELEELLDTLGCDVYFNHTTQQDEVQFPFIVYLEEGTSNFVTDNAVNQEIMEYLIIIHTIDRDNKVIDDLKTLLNSNMIPYEINAIDWNETVMAYAISFIIYL